MRSTAMTHRRGFLGRLLGTAAIAGIPLTRLRAASDAEQAASDAWLKDVRGSHKCFFDFPKHMNGFGLVHILNYVSTYASAYGLKPGDVGTVGTFYGLGGSASIAMGFNDAMWAKHALGDYMGLKDATGRPYTRNVFHRPTKADGHLLAQAAQTPNLPVFADLIVGAGIENLQKQGTKFLMCNNALVAWTMELEARGKGKADALGTELRANLLPGVAIVPAMVIAIEQAHGAGISYNRQ